MGAGKSTIGRLLATKLNYKFLDTDHLIEERTGADIPWIFDVEGERGFRDREENILVEVCGEKDIVIATGGGIVERETNRLLLREHAAVVYLSASLDLLVSRTFKDKNRPLLQVDDPKAKIIELLERRGPLYSDVSSYTVVTDGLSPKLVANTIVEHYA